MKASRRFFSLLLLAGLAAPSFAQNTGQTIAATSGQVLRMVGFFKRMLK